MTTSPEPNAKGRQIVEQEIEAIGFEIDAIQRQQVASFEAMRGLEARRAKQAHLLRMLGGEPAAYREKVAQ